LFLTDSAILGLAQELGVADRVCWGDSTVGVYLGGRIHPFTTPLDVLRFSPCSLFGRLRLGLTMLYLQKKSNWKPLASQTAYDWLAKACGPGAMQTVWGPLLDGKFSHSSREVSMAWIWARVHSRTNSRAGGFEKLGYFRGGFAVLIRRLEEELRKANVSFRLGSPVEAIELGQAGRAVRVAGESIPFDRCVFTGPSFALARLLPAGSVAETYRERLKAVRCLGAVCLVFVSDQDLAKQFWINMHEKDAPFLVCVQHTRLVGTEMYGGKHVYYLGCYLPQDSPVFQEDEESLVTRWFAYLKTIFPDFNSCRVESRHVFRFNAAQHVVDTDYLSKIPDYRTPVPGVYLANFSQIFPEDRGTNFAVREGIRIANLAREDAQATSPAKPTTS
jgi:protoporphyrinogen oxidase